MTNPKKQAEQSLELAIEQILKTYAEAEVTFIPADWHEIKEHQEAIKALTSLIQREVLKGRIEAIEQLQQDIVETDKYRSDVDQQAWAYARVHRLAQDRIKALKEEVSK